MLLMYFISRRKKSFIYSKLSFQDTGSFGYNGSAYNRIPSIVNRLAGSSELYTIRLFEIYTKLHDNQIERVNVAIDRRN